MLGSVAVAHRHLNEPLLLRAGDAHDARHGDRIGQQHVPGQFSIFTLEGVLQLASMHAIAERHVLVQPQIVERLG